MSIEDNRKIAIEFYNRFSAGDIPGALALMADDATFWLAARSAATPRRACGPSRRWRTSPAAWAASSRAG